jgi:Tol biopolymer transport system component
LGGFRLWSVPLEGGPPAKIADIDARVPDVSPDGKSVAFFLSLASRSRLS